MFALCLCKHKYLSVLLQQSQSLGGFDLSADGKWLFKTYCSDYLCKRIMEIMESGRLQRDKMEKHTKACQGWVTMC